MRTGEFTIQRSELTPLTGEFTPLTGECTPLTGEFTPLTGEFTPLTGECARTARQKLRAGGGCVNYYSSDANLPAMQPKVEASSPTMAVTMPMKKSAA
eukprot:844127-Pyramimonas_sp.AAC.1